MKAATTATVSLKVKIERVIANAEESERAGMDEEAAARDALVAQTTDVYRELAVAALVSILRRRARTRTLEHEREAEAERKASPEWQAQERERVEEEAMRRARHNRDMIQIVNQFAESLRMEWTTELLKSGFVLSNGTTVTWGEATIEHHEDRVRTFTRLAVANAEGAARHRQALRTLQETGASCLNEAVVA